MPIILLIAMLLIAACDEPSPQWRDDNAALDEETGEKDTGDENDPGDGGLIGEEDPMPDDDQPTIDCTPATPTTNEENALRQLFPNGEIFCAAKTGSGAGYFIAIKGGTTVGYAFPASNYGFDGTVAALTAISPEAKSIAVAIVSQRESWWYRLGQWFFDQFKGMLLSDITLSPKYDKNCYPCSEMYEAFKPYEVDAVSGATYTSNAVTKDVWDAFYLYDEVFTPPL